MGKRKLYYLMAAFLVSWTVQVIADKQVLASNQVADKPDSYRGPGLGEIMGVIQQQHAKLFFAGRAQNWELAQYQLDEIKEGFEMAERLHPNFKTVSAPLPKIIPVMMQTSMDDLSQAIGFKDASAFLKSYDALTFSCNNCHNAAKFDFIVIQRPSASEHSNIMFDNK